MKATRKMIMAVAAVMCTLVLTGGAAQAFPVFNQWP